MQIGEGTENQLMTIGLGKKNFRDTNLKKPPFHASFLKNALNKFQFATVHVMTYGT
jgi:hypothetical protein